MLGVPVHAIDAGRAIRTIAGWAASGPGRSVCFCNVHSVVTAVNSPEFDLALRQADLLLPDGAPVAWLMRQAGAPDQRRVCGPDLMLDLCELAARQAIPVYFYGSLPATLDKLCSKLRARWPTLRIAGMYAPPFRPLTADEDAQCIGHIRDSGAKLVFVGLGCPKQEAWMAAHRHSLDAVMLGVGAAFDFHAGNLARAPALWQRWGLEWLHRLLREPRRLAMRYLKTNTAFMVLAARQLLRRRARGPRHG